MQQQIRNRTDAVKVGLYMVTWFFSACLGPSTRDLSLEEERELRNQTEYTYSLPREQQDVARKQVECNREILERKDWHTGDYLLDALSDGDSNCEPPVPAKELNAMHGNTRAIDAIIDKNLKDALENSKK